MAKLAKAAFGVFLITLLSKVLGMVREVVLAYKYGASFITDAFVISTTLPTVVFSILLSGIMRSYIPIYSRLNNEQERSRFNYNITTLSFIISVVLMIIFYFFRDQLINILAPGFNKSAYKLAVEMTIIMLLLLPIKAIMNILAGYLNCQDKFIMVSFANYIVINVFVIIGILLSSENKILILPIIYVFGEFLALILLWRYSSKQGFKYSFLIDFKDPNLYELARLAIPMGLSLMVNQLNAVIDRMLSSTLSSGSMTALNYANKVQLLVLGLTITIIANITFPKLNRLFAENNLKGVRSNLQNSMLLTAFISIPASGFLIVFAKPVVQLLFQRGTFNEMSTIITAQALSAYSVGLVFYGYREILTQALAAIKLQKVIFMNTLLAVIINIILNIILIRHFYHIGIAAATSIAGMVSFVLLYFSLKKRIDFSGNGYMFKEIFKILIATFISISSSYVFYLQLKNYMRNDGCLIISLLLSVLIYIGLSLIIKINIAKWLLLILKKSKNEIVE